MAKPASRTVGRRAVMQILDVRCASVLLCSGASCAGARRNEEEGLELHVKWDDGFNAWIPTQELKKHPHCLVKVIDFYESRTRKRRSPPT